MHGENMDKVALIAVKSPTSLLR